MAEPAKETQERPGEGEGNAEEGVLQSQGREHLQEAGQDWGLLWWLWWVLPLHKVPHPVLEQRHSPLGSWICSLDGAQ